MYIHTGTKHGCQRMPKWIPVFRKIMTNHELRILDLGQVEQSSFFLICSPEAFPNVEKS